MYNVVFCILTNLFRIYIIKRFARVFFNDAEVEPFTEIVVYLLFYMINTGLFLEFHLPWINVSSSVLGILCVTFLYSKYWKRNIFTAASIYIIDLVCDVLVVLLFVDYMAGKEFNEKYEVLTVLLLFICELAVEKIIRHKRTEEPVYRIPLISVPVCSIVILGLFILTSWSIKIKQVIVCIGFLFINFFVFYLYDMLLKSYFDKYEKDMLQEKVNIYANQIAVILESEDKVKGLRHDMKHHIYEMKNLVVKKNASALLRYIDKMAEFIENSSEIVSSGNVEMDSLMNYMLQKAKYRLNTVNVKVNLPEHIDHLFDINIILGNLLENAMDAAQKTEEKTLNVAVRLKQGILKIEISNSFSGQLIIEKNGLISTNKDTGQHGIGLSNVRKIVDKYHGLLDICQENHVFMVKIALYMAEIETGM